MLLTFETLFSSLNYGEPYFPYTYTHDYLKNLEKI